MRLKALKGSTVYDYIVKYWQKEPQQFNREPHHMFPGLNNMPKTTFHANEWRGTVKNNPSEHIPPLKKHIGLGQIKKLN